MNEIMEKALNPVIVIFLMSAMLACGLSLKLSQIIGPFRNIRLTISATLANHLFVPLLAVAVSRLIGIEESLRYGLVLLAMTAGAEAGPKLTAMAKGNVGLAVGLMTLSLGITLFYVPLMLTVLLPEVQIDREQLLIKLSMTVALPIVIGLFLKAHYERFADLICNYVHKISSVFLFVMVALITALNYEEMLLLSGTGAILAALIFIVIAFITGYLLGWPEKGQRLAMGFMIGGRNGSVALMIAGQVFSHQPKVITMIIVTAALMILVLLPVSLYFGRRSCEESVS